ncbi:MAG TPA: hypothetical protein VMB91_02435, partial [Solirubrobacteraceae bacterium]|nr:hypothetical protein [Solirubrobacteraceae bacterium]
MRSPWLSFLGVAAFAACTTHPDLGQARVSRALQLSADGTSLWVVNTDSDSISQIDVASRTLVREILLGTALPTVDPATGRYDPAIRPRAIALADSLHKAYVAAEATSAIYVVDTDVGAVVGTIPVGAAPVAVVLSPDDTTLYAVSYEGASVARIDTSTDTVVATLPVRDHPRGASLRADGSLLYVTQFLLDPGVTVMRTVTFIPRVAFDWAQFTPLPDQPPDPGGNIDIPNG